VAYLDRAPRLRTWRECSNSALAAQYLPVETIKDVFSEVERGRTDFGVVPVENSTEGVVNYTLDMFIDSDLKIRAEIMLEVSQNLMNNLVKSGGHHEDLYPSPCRDSAGSGWKRTCPDPILNAPSTAKAAEMAADDLSAGAIASEMAAVLYGLQIVGKISRTTRTIIPASSSLPPNPRKTGRDKTSIMFSIKDKVGALYTMLVPFAEEGINLTRLDAGPRAGRSGTMCSS
jgi:chorismate mutase/prephenate dehydratase